MHIKEPEKYRTLKSAWLAKQPKTIQKYFKLLDSMSMEQRREFEQDLENLNEWKEVVGE